MSNRHPCLQSSHCPGGRGLHYRLLSKGRGLVKALLSSPAPASPPRPSLQARRVSSPNTVSHTFIHPVTAQCGEGAGAGQSMCWQSPSLVHRVLLPVWERRDLTWSPSYSKASHCDLPTKSYLGGCSLQVGQWVFIYRTFKASLGPYHFGTDVAP